MGLYENLKTEIAKPDYDGMSDADIATAINARTVTIQGDISVSDALSWCVAQGILTTLQVLSQSAGHPLQNIALAAMLMFNSLSSTFALSSSNIQGLVGALVAGTVITSDQAANLMSLGQKTVPYTQVNFGVPYVSADDITASRR